jgi:hypothetical protein
MFISFSVSDQDSHLFLKITDVLTVVRHVNKTDVQTLVHTFGVRHNRNDSPVFSR